MKRQVRVEHTQERHSSPLRLGDRENRSFLCLAEQSLCEYYKSPARLESMGIRFSILRDAFHPWVSR